MKTYKLTKTHKIVVLKKEDRYVQDRVFYAGTESGEIIGYGAILASQITDLEAYKLYLKLGYDPLDIGKTFKEAIIQAISQTLKSNGLTLQIGERPESIPLTKMQKMFGYDRLKVLEDSKAYDNAIPLNQILIRLQGE